MAERASDALGTHLDKVRPMRNHTIPKRYRKLILTVAVAAFAAVISYNHIYDLGLKVGGDSITAHLLPLVVDGTVAAMSQVMLADYSSGGAPEWLTWVGLAAGVGATVAANVDYGIQYGIQGAVIWAIPPVMFVITAEVTMLAFKREAERTRAHPDAPAPEAHLAIAPAPVPSVRSIMRDQKVGRTRAQQIRDEILETRAA